MMDHSEDGAGRLLAMMDHRKDGAGRLLAMMDHRKDGAGRLLAMTEDGGWEVISYDGSHRGRGLGGY